MKPKPFPQRRPQRLSGYDYSLAGAYFVTIVAQDRRALFGDVVEEAVQLNAIGEMVREEWLRTEILRPNVTLDEFIVMPNHLHGILMINELIVGADSRPPALERAHISAPLRRQPDSLGSIIAGFKSAVTKRINQFRSTPGEPVWQRNYHDRIIRDEDELARVREYVLYNPAMWAEDGENPENIKP